MTDTLPTADRSDLAPDDGAPIRSPRAPQQHRGQRRFEQLLDAAEALIIEQGLDAFTTNAVAERAKSSVGSLYHFFPGGKEAIVEGLAVRYLTRMRDINAETMKLELARAPLADLFHGIVMGMADFIEATPAFPQIHDRMRVQCGPNGELAEFNEAIMGNVRGYIRARLPRLDAGRVELISMVAFQTVDAVVDLSMRVTDPATRLGLLRELQVMMVRYMEPMEQQFGTARE